MTKLHELLAVEASLQSQARSAVKGLNGLFTAGIDRLKGEIRTYAPFDEDGESLPDEVAVIATTVSAALVEMKNDFSGWMNVALQKEFNNTLASAQIEIDETPLLKSLPATALLNLESKLAELKEVYKLIPTLDPTEAWNFDENLGCWVSSKRITNRTKKVPRVLVKYEATKEHPAQTEIIAEDVPVGRWTKILHSGAIPLSHKKVLLERIDTLIRATKQARQRANEQEATLEEYAETIFKYINTGKV